MPRKSGSIGSRDYGLILKKFGMSLFGMLTVAFRIRAFLLLFLDRPSRTPGSQIRKHFSGTERKIAAVHQE
jgi:hypothetical protein